jgi:S1-C subfamily serine protease
MKKILLVAILCVANLAHGKDKQCEVGPDLGAILQQARMVPVKGGFKFAVVEPNGFWDKAGFKLGDIIVKLNGVEYSTPAKMMEGMAANDGIALRYEVMRGQKLIKIAVPCYTKNRRTSR